MSAGRSPTPPSALPVRRRRSVRRLKASSSGDDQLLAWVLAREAMVPLNYGAPQAASGEGPGQDDRGEHGMACSPHRRG
ncbi:hypothetical protein AB0E04_45800 [Streptomyces sp. NPDC048251]|uniref:hypothetical protein n=1 Tax=Streptomyces sp. NPDC048251 TaxID=3154501 RepID=UPI003445DBF0